MKLYRILLLSLLCLPLSASADNDVVPQYAADKTDTMKKLAIDLSTDKCAYTPGQTVTFTATGDIPTGLKVRYRHLCDIVATDNVSSDTWTWTVPDNNYQGYMAELYTTDGTTEHIYGTIAVDVSSDWSQFPRYGFVATYGGDKTKSKTKKEMTWLNRCHINGVQFQDWHQYHDWPLGGTRDKLLDTYTDIANRTIYTRSVKYYIAAQHDFGMKSMFYNLCMGALDGYADRGVKEQWFLFQDRNHSQKDYHDLVDSWKSDIYLTNPANSEWQQYLAERNDDVYVNLDFDGYQIDQLGWRGTVYDYDGNEVYLPTAYYSFVKAMKKAHPGKRLVMNAVSECGAPEIASTGDVDFFYNEVWGNHDYDAYTKEEATFAGLKNILDRNRSYDSSKQTVFAAYMNYLRSDQYFNTPGIVMTDAVMFALGGSHLELGGDHMLSREYFPTAPVWWDDELEDWMTHYYDFMTAYENLLRGSWEENDAISARCANVTMNKWAPKAGQVTVLPRTVEGRTVVHILNFTQDGNVDNDYLLCWHDNTGMRPWPIEYEDMSVTITGVSGDVGRVWIASPDYLGGAVKEVTDFKRTSTTVKLNIPLQFWTMIVIEPTTVGIDEVTPEGVNSRETETKGYYNIVGQRVNNDYKGIVIKNGKKVLR